MNLLHSGAHEAADWLLIKIRSHSCAVELILHDDGQLQARPHTRATKPAKLGEVIGVYRRGLSYSGAQADLQLAREELMASARVVQEADYWPSRVAA